MQLYAAFKKRKINFFFFDKFPALAERNEIIINTLWPAVFRFRDSFNWSKKIGFYPQKNFSQCGRCEEKSVNISEIGLLLSDTSQRHMPGLIYLMW